jgi:hypothetical protein
MRSHRESTPITFTFTSLFCPLLPDSALPLAQPVSHSCPSSFRCSLVIHWVPALLLHLHMFPSTAPPGPYLHILCWCFLCLVPTRSNALHYYLLSFLLSSSPVSFTSPTLGYMFCIHLYVCIILLPFVLGFYSTYEREHLFSEPGKLHLRWCCQFHPLTCNWVEFPSSL